MNPRIRLFCAIWPIAAGLAPVPARADDRDPGPVIVVTAPSASDGIALRDTPDNAQVLQGDPLTRQNPLSLADLLNAGLGSVSLSNGTGSPYQNDVAYRGFQATSLLGSPSGLSVYVDGVRMNEPFGGIVNWDLIPMNATASVEVLPGSNPLFGLNTLGGSLVVATKNGADNGGLAVTVQGGSFNRRAVQVEAGGTLADKAVDWFVAGNYDRQDGYRWYTDSDVRQVTGKLRWHGETANVELAVTWADTVLHGTQSLPLSLLATPKLAYTWPDDTANRQLIVNLKGDKRLSAGVRASANVYYRGTNSTSANSNAGLGDGCDDNRDCRHDAPGGTALDLDRTNPFMAGSAAAANFAAYAGGLPIHDYTGNIATTLALSATRQRIFGGNALIDIDGQLFGLDHDINVGASFETAKIRYDQNTYLAYLVDYQTVPMPWNFRYGSDAGFQGNPLVNRVTLAARNDQANVFIRDRISLPGHVGLTGSLSYTFTHVRLQGDNATYLGEDGGYSWTGQDGQTYYNPAYIGAASWVTSDMAPSALVAAAVPDGGMAGPQVSPLTGAHAYHRLNPAIGLTWNPAAFVGLFASYSQAMRAPTAIELACADPARPCALPTGFNGDPDLAAVVAHTVEVGARGRLGHGIGWNAAIYRTSLDNDIQFIYNASGLGYFANVGATRRQGFELAVSGDFAHWHLTASYGYVQATFRSGFTDANGDAVLPGDHIPGIPAQSFKLRTIWTPSRAVALGANLIVVSGQYAHGDEANVNGMVPGYMVVNLDAHVMPTRRVELFANVSNVLDRRYATFGLMGGNIYSGQAEQFRTPAAPRAFLLGLRYSLGRGEASAEE